MKLGVIGGGVVGKATARCFLEHVEEVRVYDLVKELSTHSKSDTLASDLVVVCLPESECEDFFRRCPSGMYVLRSTVPVGFTKRISEEQHHSNLVHWPEFLTERCALTDAQMPARNVVGLPFYPDSNLSASLLFDLLRRRFPGVPLHLATSDESEAIKLMTNSFFAAKVSLFNEFRSFCDRKGMNWQRVLEGVLADGRIAHSHTQVPGPDGKRGYGGKCLPKDLHSLIRCMMETDLLLAPILNAVQVRNRWDRQDEGEVMEGDL